MVKAKANYGLMHKKLLYKQLSASEKIKVISKVVYNREKYSKPLNIADEVVCYNILDAFNLSKNKSNLKLIKTFYKSNLAQINEEVDRLNKDKDCAEFNVFEIGRPTAEDSVGQVILTAEKNECSLQQGNGKLATVIETNKKSNLENCKIEEVLEDTGVVANENIFNEYAYSRPPHNNSSNSFLSCKSIPSLDDIELTKSNCVSGAVDFDLNDSFTENISVDKNEIVFCKVNNLEPLKEDLGKHNPLNNVLLIPQTISDEVELEIENNLVTEVILEEEVLEGPGSAIENILKEHSYSRPPQNSAKHDSVLSSDSNLLEDTSLSDIDLDSNEWPKKDAYCTGVTVMFDLKDSLKEDIKASRNFNNCKNYLGSLKIDNVDWIKLFDGKGKLDTKLYPKYLSDCFYDLSPGCVFQVKSVNYSKRSTNFPTIYAYCGHNFSTTFKLKVCDSDENCKVVKVYTNAKECSHPTKKTRDLSGQFRSETKATLLSKNPKLVRLQMVEQAKSEGVHKNNLQNVKSYSVFRQAKYEANSANDLDKDPLFDLVKMRDNQTNENDRFIQHVNLM